MIGLSGVVGAFDWLALDKKENKFDDTDWWTVWEEHVIEERRWRGGGSGGHIGWKRLAPESLRFALNIRPGKPPDKKGDFS